MTKPETNKYYRWNGELYGSKGQKTFLLVVFYMTSYLFITRNIFFCYEVGIPVLSDI
jgi:hypothetical protein